MTSGTFGRTGIGLFQTAAPAQSWANRLQVRTALAGSTLYRLIWKERVTPAGRLIFALRASARPTFASGFILPLAVTAPPPLSGQILSGWPTVTARDWKDTPGATTKRKDGKTRLDRVPMLAQLTGWATPQARDHFPPHSGQYLAEKKALGHGMANLNDQVPMVGWPTPTAKMKAGGEYSDAEKAIARTQGPHANDLRDFVHLTGWPTPCQQDGPNGGPNQGTDRLPGMAPLAGWPTPTSLSPAKDYNEAGSSAGLLAISKIALTIAQQFDPPLPAGQKFLIRAQVRLTDSGPMLTGCCAEILTAPNSGPLNPEHSRWLQGIPPEWASCAPMAMRSTKKSQPVSSAL